MSDRHRFLAPTLLFDLSLTSSRHLMRLFSQSEAPFWTARKQSRFKLLRSDSPLYFVSFGWLRLIAGKDADEDRCVRMLEMYEPEMHSAGPHLGNIATHSKLKHVPIGDPVAPSLVRHQQPSGPCAGTLFLGWLKQFFAGRIVGFDVNVERAVRNCPILTLSRLPPCKSSVAHRLWTEFAIKREHYPILYENFCSATLALAVAKRNAKRPEPVFERSTSMHYSRGHLRFEPLFTTEELGLPEQANIEHVVKAFLSIAEGVAARWIEMPSCALLLQAIEGNPGVRRDLSV